MSDRGDSRERDVPAAGFTEPGIRFHSGEPDLCKPRALKRNSCDYDVDAFHS